MNNLCRTPSKIARERCQVYTRWYLEQGEQGVRSLIEETDARALDTARRLGIEQMDITRMWFPWFPPMCTPTYLLGEGAPQIKTCKDALAHSDIAEYQIVIRDKADL